MDKYPVAGVICLLLIAVTAEIQLVGHGYQNIAVIIDGKVQENPALLTKLEEILTQGSAALFRATKKQAYFREFIFVLPENWSTQKHYETALSLYKPDIIIDLPNEDSEDTPYVSNPYGCGVAGDFMHLTPNYILDESVMERYGPPGKLFVHEWSHLRWGVMDEYATDPNEEFYQDPVSGMWLGTRCTKEITGEIVNMKTGSNCGDYPAENRPPADCMFVADLQGPGVASLMFMQHIDTVEEFCDNPSTAPDHLKHNRLAPNDQNMMCHHKSVWEVLREHADLKKLSSLPALNDNTDTRPNFRYVQVRSRKRVLVLDTSASMKGKAMIQLRQAASNFILGTADDGSHLGIVGFSGSSSTLSDLVQINGEDDRHNLMNALPTTTAAGDSTSLGAGLRQGIELLEDGGSAAGGSIILITDGIDNGYPFIKDVLSTLRDQRVAVHTIAIGQRADLKLRALSEDTGGEAFYFSGRQGSTALIDGLAATIATESSVMSNKNIPLSILTETGMITQSSPLTGTFYIDSTIGRDTTLIFTAETDIKVDLKSPDGPYDAPTPKEYTEGRSKFIKITLPNDLKPGLWSYDVTTTSTTSSFVTVNIQSKSRTEEQETIQIQSWVSQDKDVSFSSSTTLGIYAEVTRGKTPVINASVTATVEMPSGKKIVLPLYDKAIGIDTRKEDGVYSANLIPTDFDGNGRYSIKVKVLGTKSQTRVFVERQRSANAALDLRSREYGSPDSPTEPLEGFQRVTTAGEFRLSGYKKLTTDGLPPARITDFILKKMDWKEWKATLEWTAVGEDMERGRATRYQIYVSYDLEDIIGNKAPAVLVSDDQVVQGDLNSPSAPGSREQVILGVRQLSRKTHDALFLTIVAVDDVNNAGEHSNMVIISNAQQMGNGGGGFGYLQSNNHLLITFVVMVSAALERLI